MYDIFLCYMQQIWIALFSLSVYSIHTFFHAIFLSPKIDIVIVLSLKIRTVNDCIYSIFQQLQTA